MIMKIKMYVHNEKYFSVIAIVKENKFEKLMVKDKVISNYAK